MKIELNKTISYTKYNNIDYDNICIAMCFFNPINYTNNLKNINTLIQEFQKTNIPFYIIELVYPQQIPSINNATKIVNGNSYYFVKENLWNILEKYIPDKYDNIIFLDSDVLFSDPNWVNRVADKLSTHKVVHAAEYFYRDLDNNNIYKEVNLENNNTKCSIVKAFKCHEDLTAFNFHPGFNISINRNFYHDIGGFFDHCPVTIGDTLFWLCFKPNYRMYAGTFFCAPNFKKQKSLYTEYQHNLANLCNISLDIDYIENNIGLHLYHGKIPNRNYGKQFSFIPGPFTLWYNNDGVLEIDIKHPFVKDLKAYFQARKEDD